MSELSGTHGESHVQENSLARSVSRNDDLVVSTVLLALGEIFQVS